MNTLLEVLRYAHVVGGAIALVAFWVPALARKESPLHRRAGRIYVRGMTVVLATSLPLSALSFVRGNWVAGTFLLYLFVITGTALYTGVRALRSKAGPQHLITPMYVATAWATLLGGAAVLVTGVATKTWLLAGFSLIGLTAGPSPLAFVRKPPSDSRLRLAMIRDGETRYGAANMVTIPELFPTLTRAVWSEMYAPVSVSNASNGRSASCAIRGV